MIGTLYSNIAYSQQTLTGTLDSSSRSKTPEAASEDTLINRLASNSPGMSASDLKSLNEDDFSPEKVANRIGDFVAQGLEAARRNGRSEADIQNMYNAAVKGVEKGFAEAREILDGLGVLSGSIASNIDLTEDKTMDALSAINPGKDTADSNVVSRLTAAERYQEAETLSLKVKTQDGDEVTIRFSRESQSTGAFGIEQNRDGSTSALFDISRSESSQYQFSVNGDLDDSEIDALQNLIQDVNEISNEFFDGDVQKAFEMASEYNMDKTELASMNLRLTQSEQYTSVAKYRSVENLDNPAVNNPGKRLGHMANNLWNTSENQGLGFLKDAKSFSQELLSTLVTQDIRFRESDESQQAKYKSNLDFLNTLMTNAPTDLQSE